MTPIHSNGATSVLDRTAETELDAQIAGTAPDTEEPRQRSVFEPFASKFYKYQYAATLHMDSIAGGVPTDPKVIEGHLGRQVGLQPEELIRQEAIEIMAERGLGLEEAVEEMASVKGRTGFRSNPVHGLFIGGYQVKAALKEGASIAAAAGNLRKAGWGTTSKNKGILSWMAEHVIVKDHRIYLGITEPNWDPSGPNSVEQGFISKMTPRGPITAIQYTEVVRGVDISVHIETDWQFAEEEWAAIWLAGERNGLGASRKMGFGTYSVTRWEQLKG